MFSEDELLLRNWLSLISGETELALAQFGEAHSLPKGRIILYDISVSAEFSVPVTLAELLLRRERTLWRGGSLRSLQQKGCTPGVLQGGSRSHPRHWASELLLEPVDPGTGAAACKIQPWTPAALAQRV